jgi:hypothetical protein
MSDQANSHASDRSDQVSHHSNPHASDRSHEVSHHNNPHASGGDPPCFMEGTLMRTQSGDVPVEMLKAGDLIILSDHTVTPLRWLGRSTVSAPFVDPVRMLPIRIKAGALVRDLPRRDLLVSPGHALLIDNILIEAGALVNCVSILREEDVPATFRYYHVELERHAVILAEGAPAESFVDNADRFVFDNWADHESLHPGPAPIEEMAYPRAKSQRQVPKATLLRLTRLGSVFHTEMKAHAA